MNVNMFNGGEKTVKRPQNIHNQINLKSTDATNVGITGYDRENSM